jgi:hypothetical protein
VLSVVLAATAASAPAQETKVYPLVGVAQLTPDGQRIVPVAQGGGQVRERYEEIEILARLIDRALIRYARVGHLTDAGGSVAFSPDGKLLATARDGNVRLWDPQTGKSVSGPAAAEFSGAQGVYLKGQGIVYALTVPLHFQKPVAGPTKPAPKELTPWERVRQELRGEKVEAEKPREPADMSIADTVLKVLAENGKNLTRLPDGENVTFAITLPAPQSCVTCHAGKGGGMTGGGGPGMMPGGMGSGGPPGSGGGLSGAGVGPPGSGMAPGGGFGPPGGSGSRSGPPAVGGADSGPDTSRAEFRKYALLGDLAMKQHDYNQAAEAYMKASAVYKQPPSEADAQLEVIELGSKLARALMALGKKAEAENVVKAVAQLSDRLAGGAAPTKPVEGKSQIPLPAKLIIEVRKALIDQLGSGKITFDEFRKAASVEHLTFDKS